MRQLEDTPKQQDAAAKQRSLFCKLVDACKRKELATIREILAEQPQLLNLHDKHHRNLLHYTSILVLREPEPHEQQQQQQRVGKEHAAAGGESEGEGEGARCLECFRFLLARCEPRLWTKRDRDGLTVLHLAIISGNVHLVREILLRGKQPQQQQPDQSCDLSALVTILDREHHAPLHWAVITNNLECVRLLVGHSGVQLAHQPDLNGATPLHYATQTSDYPKYRQQLRQMLKNATSTRRAGDPPSSPSGAREPSAASRQQSESLARAEAPLASTTIKSRRRLERAATGSEQTAGSATSRWSLEDAAEAWPPDHRPAGGGGGGGAGGLEVLKFLVQLPGVNLECRDKDSRTPLLWAASSGNRRAILLLLHSGANPLCQDANKLGPLHCAASHGFTDCLEGLLAPAPAPLSAALAAFGQQQVNQPDNLACTPLFYAVLSGNIDCVDLLLERGARHDWQDVKGRTAAHFAALKGQLSTLKLLEARGANLWSANKQGDLPLHYAIKSGRQQVVAWLLANSPYERAVNAINNTGRAPIHLATLKGNPAMVEFLIGQGASLNQLVKVRDKSSAGVRQSVGAQAPSRAVAAAGSSSYHYETALDMARRLGRRECLELLERLDAQSADWVLARRGQQQQQQQRACLVDSSASTASGAVTKAGDARSLFEQQAAGVGASPIGFETSGSSTEPPALSERSPVEPARLPQLPGRPEPLESRAPLSDSTNSSALSQSSLTSVRGARPPGAGSEAAPEPLDRTARPMAATRQQLQQQYDRAADTSARPYRGGINYHNERINASIKCKLYENQSGQHSRSLPAPGASRGTAAGAAHPARAQYHSAGSLADRQAAAAAAAGGQQEIITNVNVYTTSPHCVQCHGREDEQLFGHCRWDCPARESRTKSSGDALDKRTGESAQRASHELSETSDTSDATPSEILFDQEEEDDQEPEAAAAASAVSDQSDQSEPPERTYRDAAPGRGHDQQAVGQQARYLPLSQAYTQHLPVILSAGEERSTSGDTNNEPCRAPSVSPSDLLDGLPHTTEPHTTTPVPVARGPAPSEPPPGGGGGRGAARPPATRPPVDRYREHARSPVAEYIRGRESDVRGWSHVGAHAGPLARAKADSHRNDSGLSSHFGDDPDAEPSSVGRRSKSWSTLDSHRAASRQQAAAAAAGLGGSDSSARALHSPCALAAGAEAAHHHPHAHQHQHPHRHHHNQLHQQQQGADERAARALFGSSHDVGPRSCSRQTIIRTRRLSVDSVELASSVGKSIRRYKQENKLFEELQNLKRSQIRSGRANEALLVKRLVERFRREIQRDTLIGLEPYRGQYTYQAYELYLYDQLRRISRANEAKLTGALAPHTFTHERRECQLVAAEQPADMPSGYEARDFFDEDLKAELELQRVINESDGPLRRAARPARQVGPHEAPATLIEPSGALEEIRVRRRSSPAATERLLEPERQLGAAAAVAEADQPPAPKIRRHSSDTDALSSQSSERDSTEQTEIERDEKEEEQAQDEAERAPPQKPRAPLGAPGPASSSTASSRRSSIEVEREKLDSLPLRVQEHRADQPAEPARNSEGEHDTSCSLASKADECRAPGETQEPDLDLAAAIVTDALGNVSRPSPQVGFSERPEVAADDDDDDGGDHSQGSSTAEGQDEEAAPSEPAAEPAKRPSDGDSRRQRAFAARGRRRSVVNIGNKMEVIYHNVGIEIDTVGENPPSDDDEPPGAGAASEQRAATCEPSAQEDLPALAEESTSAREQPGPSSEPFEGQDDGTIGCGSDTQERAPDEHEHESRGATCEPLADADGARGSLDKSDDDDERRSAGGASASRSAAPFGSSESARDLAASERNTKLSRRASSPPAPFSAAPPESLPAVGARRFKAPFDRRSSADQHQPTTTSDMIVIERKVFNGFDLDSFRAHRRRHWEAQEREGREREQVQESRAKEGADRKRATVAARIAREAARRRPPRPRSKPPPGPYLVYVPTELIHERWLAVKRHERKMLRARRESIFAADANDLPVARSKSQAFLADRNFSAPLETFSEQPTTEDGDRLNFKLIYELNKTSAASRPEASGSSPGATWRARDEIGPAMRKSARMELRKLDRVWCRRRVTRVVDMRTLKRTLSLPECLIYSNNLLKRFDILKL